MAVALALPGWGTPPERLEPLCARLREHGVDARPWAYEARGSISQIGRLLAEAAAAAGGRDRPVHLVGHSLGGLASASAVLEHGAEVASVTTINSPWRGTWVAWTASPQDPLGRELRWGAVALDRLRGSLADHLRDAHGPRWSVIGTALDIATTPATSVRVPRGPRLRTSIVPVSGHSLSLMKQPMTEHVTSVVVDAA